MERQIEQIKVGSCHNDEIAAYVDGELSPERELTLEMHFTECGTCLEELNLQKQFLCTLNASMNSNNEIDLPADFASRIVKNAESSVIGLRKPGERFNALFICAALGLFALFAFGADAWVLSSGISRSIDQISAVVSLFVHFIYSLIVGVGAVIRTLGGQFQFPAAVLLAFLMILVVLAFPISRVFDRYRQT